MTTILDEILTKKTGVDHHTHGCRCPQCRQVEIQRNSHLNELLSEQSESRSGAPYPEVNAPLPKQGDGFYCYAYFRNRFFGLPETIEALKTIGRMWKREQPNGPRIGIGDISNPGGRKFTFRPDHVSHRIGLDVDIRPIRNDGKEAGTKVGQSTYSHQLTRRLIEIIRNNGVLNVKAIGFQDPKIPGVSNWSGHADHLHVRFCLPAGYETRYPSLKKYGGRSRFSCSKPASKPRQAPKAVPVDNSSVLALLQRAIAAGERDENKLTDLYFYRLHPELPKGYKIKRHEKQLAREWLNIRQQIVRPMLAQTGIGAGAGKHPVPTKSSIPQRLQILIPLLNKYRGDIPLHFLLGWIKIESDGNNSVKTHLDERGYFQIHPEESKDLGLDHARISSDKDYSIQSGIRLVRNKMKYADSTAKKLGIPGGSDLYWHIVKLYHWVPLSVDVITKTMQAQGFRPQTWETFRRFMLDNRDRIKEAVIQRARKWNEAWDVTRGIRNVEKLFAAANSYLK